MTKSSDYIYATFYMFFYQVRGVNTEDDAHQGTLLLTWFNFNFNMDK